MEDTNFDIEDLLVRLNTELSRRESFFKDLTGSDVPKSHSSVLDKIAETKAKAEDGYVFRPTIKDNYKPNAPKDTGELLDGYKSELLGELDKIKHDIHLMESGLNPEDAYKNVLKSESDWSRSFMAYTPYVKIANLYVDEQIDYINSQLKYTHLKVMKASSNTLNSVYLDIDTDVLANVGLELTFDTRHMYLFIDVDYDDYIDKNLASNNLEELSEKLDDLTVRLDNNLKSFDNIVKAEKYLAKRKLFKNTKKMRRRNRTVSDAKISLIGDFEHQMYKFYKIASKIQAATDQTRQSELKEDVFNDLRKCFELLRDRLYVNVKM